MTSPRLFAASIAGVAALVVLTGCGSSGTPSAEPTSPYSVAPLPSDSTSPSSPATSAATTPTPTATPTVITYPSDGLNINTKNVQTALVNTSPEFRAFINQQLHTLWKRGGAVPGCQNSALIVLSTYSSAGYAGASDEGMFGGACSRGGSNALYAQVNGSWQEIAATQAGYDCSILQKYKVPVSIAGHTCSDASGNSQPYNG